MKWLKSVWRKPEKTPEKEESTDSPKPSANFFSRAWDELNRLKLSGEKPLAHLFTPRARQVLALARKEADRLNHNFVGTEHLLLGLIHLGQGVAVEVLQKMV